MVLYDIPNLKPLGERKKKKESFNPRNNFYPLKKKTKKHQRAAVPLIQVGQKYFQVIVCSSRGVQYTEEMDKKKPGRRRFTARE